MPFHTDEHDEPDHVFPEHDDMMEPMEEPMEPEMDDEPPDDMADEEVIEELQDRGHNPMDTGTQEELQMGHSLLHGWVEGEGDEPGEPRVDEDATDWSPDLIEEEHERMVHEMEDRDIDHNSPLEL